MLPVGPLRVPLRYLLHDPRQGSIAHLDLQVDVVRHETKGENAVVKLIGYIQSGIKTEAILVIVEDVLVVIAAEDNMVDGTGRVYARFPWHEERIPRDVKLSRPVPMSPRSLRAT
jgi:hypothetical protein